MSFEPHESELDLTYSERYKVVKTLLYSSTYLPTPRVQKFGDIQKSLHCKNVIFDNVSIILSESHAKAFQMFPMLITALENFANFLPCIVVLVKLPVKCLCVSLFPTFQSKNVLGRVNASLCGIMSTLILKQTSKEARVLLDIAWYFKNNCFTSAHWV